MYDVITHVAAFSSAEYVSEKENLNKCCVIPLICSQFKKK